MTIVVWILCWLAKHLPSDPTILMTKLYIFEASFNDANGDPIEAYQIVLATDWNHALELALAVKPGDLCELVELKRNGVVDAIQRLPDGDGPYR